MRITRRFSTASPVFTLLVLLVLAPLASADSLRVGYFDLPPRFLGLQALKFQRVITPGMRVLLELQHDAAKSQLSFRLHSEGGQHASGRFLLGAA